MFVVSVAEHTLDAVIFLHVTHIFHNEVGSCSQGLQDTDPSRPPPERAASGGWGSRSRRRVPAQRSLADLDPRDCWLGGDLQASAQRECHSYAAPCLTVTICSLRLWESTQVYSPALAYFQGHLYDPSSSQPTPPSFIHLLFQLCEQWYIASELPALGNSWRTEVLEKNILLSSQLGDLHLFQPTAHLDSSVCSLLTLGEWAAPEWALVSTWEAVSLFPPAVRWSHEA